MTNCGWRRLKKHFYINKYTPFLNKLWCKSRKILNQYYILQFSYPEFCGTLRQHRGNLLCFPPHVFPASRILIYRKLKCCIFYTRYCVARAEAGCAAWNWTSNWHSFNRLNAVDWNKNTFDALQSKMQFKKCCPPTVITAGSEDAMSNNSIGPRSDQNK